MDLYQYNNKKNIAANCLNNFCIATKMNQFCVEKVFFISYIQSLLLNFFSLEFCLIYIQMYIDVETSVVTIQMSKMVTAKSVFALQYELPTRIPHF